jgi:hypothetical protein
MSNWRKPEDYAYTASLTMRAWAWEFLRRNPEYQSEWSKWRLDGPAKVRDRDIVRATRAAGKWGLRCPIDPAKRAEGDFIWWRTELLSAAVVVLNREHATETLAAYPETTFIGFDRRKPIDPQIRDARSILSKVWSGRHRKAVTKAQRRNWVLYLRVLDGHRQRIRNKAIATLLLDDPSAGADITNTLRQAQRLVSMGYRDIISLEAARAPTKVKKR